MLILSRRVDESLIIGDEVTVTLLSIKGKQVRLGISAPDEVSIHREEVYKMLQKIDESGVKPTLAENPARETKE